MFGILRPCARHSRPSVHEAWRAHLCGLCLTLRDRHGQVARAATNYDGLILSVLAEAQRPDGRERRTAGPCALRAFRTAEVVPSAAEGARLAAAVSLALAAGKIRDHAADGDGVAGLPVRGAPIRAVAASWAAAAERGGRSIGFDTAVLTEAAGRQAVLEGTPGLTLLQLTEPTEAAVAAAFAHTAVLAGRPGNAGSLREAGLHFGRIAHILDAVEDFDADQARGAYNPLAATGTSVEEARRLCERSLHGLALAVQDLDLADRHLVEALLRDETRRAVRRAFPAHPGGSPHPGGIAQGSPHSGGAAHPQASPHPQASHPYGSPHPGGSACSGHARPSAGRAVPENLAGSGHLGGPASPGAVGKVLAGGLTFVTCGLYRPPWSPYRDAPWHARCYLDGCDCCPCDECCCDGCSCDGCGCDGCCCDCDCCSCDC